MKSSRPMLLLAALSLTACLGSRTPPDDVLMPADPPETPTPHVPVDVDKPVIERDAPPEVPVVTPPRQPGPQGDPTRPLLRPEQNKGRIVAVQSDLTRRGFWLVTPQVQSEVPGRIVVAESGAGLNVTLLPGSGSQAALSRAAVLTLGLSPEESVELQVFIR